MRTLLFILGTLPALVLRAQSLDEHLERAIELNPGLQARYAEFEAALVRSAQVRGLPDPTLSIGYFISPVETRVGPQRARFSLTQVFPWFGTLGAQAEATDLLAEARYQAFLEARNELVYKVRMAYYPLHELDRAVELERADLEILRSHQDLALARFESGKGRMVDVLRTELAINEAEVDIALLEERREPLRVAFVRTVGYAEDVPVSTRDSLGLVDLSLLRPSDSLAMDPRLHELDLRMDAALSQAEAARRMGAPRMGLGIDYVVVDERTDMDLPDNGRDVIMPMFSVSLPIYRSKYRSGVEEAEALQRSYELLRVQRGNDLAAAYETARYEAYKAARMAQLMDAQIAVNERILELLLAAYSGNGSDFEEVLRTQQQLLRQRLMRLSALREHHAAIARIDLLTAKRP